MLRNKTSRLGLQLLLPALLCARLSYAHAVPALDKPMEPHNLLLAANQAEATLSIFDAATGEQLSKVPEENITGHEVAASVDGKIAYVPIYGDSSVGEPGSDGQELIAIDLGSRTILNRLDFGHPIRPHCIVMNQRDGLLYVTTEIDHTVSIVDPQSFKIVGAIGTGQSESHMLALSHDGRFGYVANVGPGTVSVLDLVERKLLAIIPVAAKIERISISADDSKVFVADQAATRLAVIDTTTRRVARWIGLPSRGFGTASTPDGRWLLVSLPLASQVAVVDLSRLQVVRTIEVPTKPVGIVISPNDDVAYVSCAGSGKIAVLTLSDWIVRRVLTAGKHVDGLALVSAR
jgi:DNA-binding beta-propeller fold protein YncE